MEKLQASRTLYVGGLESNPTEQSLRRRYERFGTILEIDVKNPESPAPFAFLHFADMDSTVKAVNHFQQNFVTGGFTKKSKVWAVLYQKKRVIGKFWKNPCLKQALGWAVATEFYGGVLETAIEGNVRGSDRGYL